MQFTELKWDRDRKPMGRIRTRAEVAYCVILDALGLTAVLHRHLLRLCRHHLPNPFLWESACVTDYAHNVGLGYWMIKLVGYRPLHKTSDLQEMFLACRCTDGTISCILLGGEKIRTVKSAIIWLNSQ